MPYKTYKAIFGILSTNELHYTDRFWIEATLDTQVQVGWGIDKCRWWSGITTGKVLEEKAGRL